jgi:hypothetical protein
MSLAADVFTALRDASHPVVGVSLVDETNQASWSLDFAPGATAPQITAANDALVALSLPGLLLAAAKVAKVEAVAAELRARNRAGFTHGGSVYRIDDGALAAIAVIQAAAPWPGGVGYFAADDTPIAFTGAQFTTFAHAVAVKALERLAHARGLRVAIAAAANQAALDLIDVTAGWP